MTFDEVLTLALSVQGDKVVLQPPGIDPVLLEPEAARKIAKALWAAADEAGANWVREMKLQ